MNYYKVEKKRDGQNWKPFNEIFASSFDEAKKQFAKDMTEDNWNKSNNIVWLNAGHGVKVSGWYDLNSGKAVYDEETESWESTDECLLVSEEQINEGFDFWSEDVYSWRVLDLETENSKSEHSADIKTEILSIIDAFGLGSFVGLLSFTPSEKVEGYILTEFETTTGKYEHYFRIKD